MSDAARNWVRQAVTGMTGGLADPDPIAALRALVSLRHELGEAEQSAALRARQQRRTWEEIGEALGLRPGLRGATAAERARQRFGDIRDEEDPQS